MRRLWAASVVIALTTGVVGCVSPAYNASSSPHFHLGVYEPGTPESYRPIDDFATTMRKRPDIALYYSGWPERFRTSFAQQANSHGASVLIQIDPTNIDLAALARGRYDRYITWYAKAVRSYGRRVIIGFGHEMNGTWYSWAWGHTSPAVWVDAWRRMVNIFRQQDANNVTWMWTITRISASTGPLQDWWPGASYVNWVGIDGYYYKRTDTFKTVFGRTITNVRRLTNKPILLSEVGIGQVAGQAAQIPGLFAGIKREHLLGLVWFDVDQHGSQYAQDWRLEGHRGAIEAFSRAAATLTKPGN